MTEGEFFYLLLGTSYHAYKFGKQYVTNDLPSEFKYEVHLGCSYDKNCGEDFKLFPEESGKVLYDLSEADVIECLLRDGNVPVWIDIAIYKEAKESTILRLICAGRFTDNPECFYYTRVGAGPFGVKGPDFPSDWEQGELFELQKA